jgi:hypothetical protein
MSTDEWDIFSRIEGLEEITLDLMEKGEAVEPNIKSLTENLREIDSLAMITMIMLYIKVAGDRPNSSRVIKDYLIDLLKEVGVGNTRINYMEKYMLRFCEKIEANR